MAAHERGIERAKWSAQATLATLGREIRTARLAHDLSQVAVAQSVGISASKWGRMERGEASGASFEDLAQALAIVGLDLHVRAYPGGQALRDSAHLQVLARLHERLGAAVGWRTEVPLPNPGDRRAWDALIVVEAVRIGVEAETRARDSQALQRRLALKRRDGAVDHVILLLADTRNNRSFVRSCGAGFLAEYPLAGRAILRQLERSQDPGGSGIVFV